MRYHTGIYGFIFFSLLLSFTVFSQDKQGNIVEYFGKEKVVDVSEGEVIHVFHDGLLLKMNRNRFSSSSVAKNPVYGRFLLENPSEIKEGEVFTTDFTGTPAKWEKIETGEKNEFQDNGLRSGYLYLEYRAEKAVTVLFEASGHTMALINGLPHEGDHYDYGWTLIPLKLKKGKNEFVLKGGRFARMRARLIKPSKSIAFTKRDMTLPDLLTEEDDPLWGAIRVMNNIDHWFSGGSITCNLKDQSITTPLPTISPLNIRKVPFKIPAGINLNEEETSIQIQLLNKKGNILATDSIELNVKSKYNHHKRTFISDIDGSVQYYSVAPSSAKDIKDPALFFSVHGASVEAVNQANAYKKKDWGHIVAPTNRRAFGFAWEDWGRLDALEVFDHASSLLQTDPQRTYLTGHSMGGHGTWYLGATYPDRWAAIAPCAGYPDLLGYRASFSRRLKNATDEELAGFGITKAQVAEMLRKTPLDNETDILLDSMIRRAGNPSRTLKLKRNYLHHGVYVLHGEKDSVVPTFIAREMREILGKFHNDFTYYEYPNGSHWYGDHSVDWPPIFDYFDFRSIKAPQDIDKIEFYTASPGVSAGSHFVSILQQRIPFEISSFKFERDSISSLTTDNAQTIAIDLDQMGNNAPAIVVDGQEISLGNHADHLYLRKVNGQWQTISKPSMKDKGPHRNGGFKDAFRNNMVFVFATKGSKTENEWYYQRAKFDAEKFQYRANGNVELIKDTDFSLDKYSDRNVILYGNSTNNSAWDSLLKNCPLQVSKGKLSMGDHTLEGTQWGTYFIYPRTDSETASIGVVTATGIDGMKSAYANDYLVNGTTFPDVIIFSKDILTEGVSAIQCAGFFGNDWSVEAGDFVWRSK